jgi:dihydrofolate reductase
MRTIHVFNNVSIDGYFCDEKSDMSWAHNQDPEWEKFSADNAKGGGMMLFGRKTYDLMVKFWPTEEAAKQMPEVAEGMNRMPKIVFSTTLDKATWKNTTVIKSDIVKAVRELKQQDGPNMVIMGSGTIVSQLAQAKLIDEFMIVTIPLVLGKGRTMFETVTERFRLKPTQTRTFKNGNIVVNYVLA